jgi:hypothetical protein
MITVYLKQKESGQRAKGGGSGDVRDAPKCFAQLSHQLPTRVYLDSTMQRPTHNTKAHPTSAEEANAMFVKVINVGA